MHSLPHSVQKHIDVIGRCGRCDYRPVLRLTALDFGQAPDDVVIAAVTGHMERIRERTMRLKQTPAQREYGARRAAHHARGGSPRSY